MQIKLHIGDIYIKATYVGKVVLYMKKKIHLRKMLCTKLCIRKYKECILYVNTYKNIYVKSHCGTKGDFNLSNRAEF